MRIEGVDRAGIERLVRYCARPPFALERLHAFDGTAAHPSLSLMNANVPEGARTPWLEEGGKGTKPIVVHFQVRPTPLAH